jgi:hypothetical protein
MVNIAAMDIQGSYPAKRLDILRLFFSVSKKMPGKYADLRLGKGRFLHNHFNYSLLILSLDITNVQPELQTALLHKPYIK